MTITVRDKLGGEYKLLLRKFLDLIEKKRAEFLERCFDSHEVYNPERGVTTYEYEKAEICREVYICVLEKDQARCTLCHEKMPIPTATRCTFDHSMQPTCLPEVCLPASLPPSIVKDCIIRDIRETGEDVRLSRGNCWKWDGSPHEEDPCTVMNTAVGIIQHRATSSINTSYSLRSGGRQQRCVHKMRPAPAPVAPCAKFEQGLCMFFLVVRFPMV